MGFDCLSKPCQSADKRWDGYFNKRHGRCPFGVKGHIMQAWSSSVVGRWRRWSRRHWSLAVDDTGPVVRWVCLRQAPGEPSQCVGAGQWPGGTKTDVWPDAFQGMPIALALPTGVVVQRHVAMPQTWDEDDQPTWAQSVMAQTMGLPMPEVAVDWGPEIDADALWWVAGVRSSVVRGREQWAQAHGSTLCLLDTQSLALERVLCASVQGHTDPVWLWWAGRDEGVLCTGWWHLGHWHDRQDVPMDVQHLDQMPSALLGLVRAAQTQKPTLSRMQWWWAGDALAPWAARWAADPPKACRAWHCQPATLPFAGRIEAEAQAPAHAWALALGLAMHPGRR